MSTDTTQNTMTPFQAEQHESEQETQMTNDQPTSRRRVLKAALGVAAATMGAATLLKAPTGTALANGLETPTTFSSTTSTPAVTATNTYTGYGIGVLAQSNNGDAIQAYAYTWNRSAVYAAGGPGYGVYAISGGKTDTVYAANSGTGNAVHAVNNGTSSSALFAEGQSGYGLYATSKGNQPAVEAWASSTSRGGFFYGGAAAIQLAPAGATHPASGQAGDLFVDSSANLWFCKGGTNWRQLA